MPNAIGTPALPAFLNALDYAREGIDRGVQSFDRVAQSVAGAAGNPAALSAAHEAEALTALNQVAASARVFETGDQLLGTILDLRA